MRAALAARRDPNFVIVGRTSAAGISNLDDAILRAKTYASTGVDAIFLAAIRSRHELEAIADAVDVPIILGGVDSSFMDLNYLARLGVRICLQGHQTFLAAVQAVHTTLSALRAGASPDELVDTATLQLVKRLCRQDEYDRFSKEFLGTTK